MLTLISGGEFCASRGVSHAGVSTIPSMIRRFISSFLILRKPLACGRLHFNAPDEAQVKFMAVNARMRVVAATGVAFSRDWRPRQRVAALRSSC